VIAMMQPTVPVFTWLFVPIVIGGFVTGIFIVLGALRMMRLQSHGWAMIASILALLPCAGPLWLLGLAMGIWSLIVLNRSNVRAAFAAQRGSRSAAAATSVSPSDFGQPSGNTISPAPQRRFWNVLTIIAVLFLCVCLCCIIAVPVMFLLPTYVSREPSRDTASHRELVNPQAPAEARPFGPAPWRGWDWGPKGPQVYEPLARSGLGLDDLEIQEVNDILQAIHREYLDLEAKHRSQQRNADGHLVTTISSIDTADLENRLWSQLDAVLVTEEQQKIARLNLKIHPRYRYQPQVGVPVPEFARPGLFGWGADGGQIEIWRVGSWYSWRVRASPKQNVHHNVEDSGPELPYEFRRFWTEPPAEQSPPEKLPAEKTPPAEPKAPIEKSP
jgi:hypothetical protein